MSLQDNLGYVFTCVTCWYASMCWRCISRVWVFQKELARSSETPVCLLRTTYSCTFINLTAYLSTLQAKFFCVNVILNFRKGRLGYRWYSCSGTTDYTRPLFTNRRGAPLKVSRRVNEKENRRQRREKEGKNIYRVGVYRAIYRHD